jgi:ribosomal protein L7/L12
LPDQVASIFKNLKLVLETARCVFVLAMDTRIVANSIETHYSSRHGNENPIEPAFGDRFLEKLIQITFDVPPLTREAVARYLDSLGVAEEVQEIVNWAPNDEVLNPRRLKRYLNWLSVTLQLIRSVRLPSTVRNVTALRALAVKRDFPELYKLLVTDSVFSVDNEEFGAYLRSIVGQELLDFDAFLDQTPMLEPQRKRSSHGELTYSTPESGIPAYDVTLTAVGENKISVIKALREIAPLGLKEAKDIVEAAPTSIKKRVTRDEAEAIQRKFTETGASVDIRPARAISARPVGSS